MTPRQRERSAPGVGKMCNFSEALLAGHDVDFQCSPHASTNVHTHTHTHKGNQFGDPGPSHCGDLVCSLTRTQTMILIFAETGK